MMGVINYLQRNKHAVVKTQERTAFLPHALRQGFPRRKCDELAHERELLADAHRENAGLKRELAEVKAELQRLSMGSGLMNASTPAGDIRKMAVAVVAENERLRETVRELYVAVDDCRGWAAEYDFMDAPRYKRMVGALAKHKDVAGGER